MPGYGVPMPIRNDPRRTTYAGALPNMQQAMPFTAMIWYIIGSTPAHVEHMGPSLRTPHALAHTTQNETTYVHRPKQLYFTTSSNVDIGEVIYTNVTIGHSMSLPCITRFKSIEANKSTGEHASQSYLSGIDQIVPRIPTKYTVTSTCTSNVSSYMSSVHGPQVN